MLDMDKGFNPAVRWLLIVILIFGSGGCGGWEYKNLKSTNQIGGETLRQNWDDHVVYFRPSSAILYKLKKDRKIQLPSSWVKVTRKDEINSYAVFFLDDVLEIRGANDELYGYLIYTYRDRAVVRIIDDHTIELLYTHQIKEGP
jgi:hypothetical protein